LHVNLGISTPGVQHLRKRGEGGKGTLSQMRSLKHSSLKMEENEREKREREANLVGGDAAVLLDVNDASAAGPPGPAVGVVAEATAVAEVHAEQVGAEVVDVVVADLLRSRNEGPG
jgi:hypothetical protein